jgi:hypothetical protein
MRKSKVMRSIFAVIFSLSLYFYSSLTASSSDLHAVIEIGSSGVKALVFQIAPKEAREAEEAFQSDEGSAELARGLKYELIKPDEKLNYEEIETNAYRADNIQRTVDVVREFTERIYRDRAVTEDDVSVVISSGVARQAHSGQLVERLKESGVDQILVLTPQQECEFTYRWIVPRYRYNQVSVIDVGSGNVKACYVDFSGRDKWEIRAIELFAVGTKTFAADVLKNIEDKGLTPSDFASEARKLRESRLATQALSRVASHPAFLSRRRIYLAGGIVFATSTLVRPDKVGEKWVSFSAEDIRTLYNRAVRGRTFDVNLNRIPPQRSEQRKLAEREVARLRERIFAPHEVIAGLEILTAVDNLINLRAKQGVFFAAVARDGWRSQYLIETVSRK